MPGSPTTRMGLATMLGTDLGQTIDNTYDAAMATLDAEGVMFSQGVLASRPVSTSGSPGKTGRLYFATDVVKLYYDFGTGWSEIMINPSSRGLTASGNTAALGGSFTAIPGMTTTLTVSAGQAVECEGMAYLKSGSSTGLVQAHWTIVDAASVTTYGMDSFLPGAVFPSGQGMPVPVIARFVPANAGSCTVTMEAWSNGSNPGIAVGSNTQGIVRARS